MILRQETYPTPHNPQTCLYPKCKRSRLCWSAFTLLLFLALSARSVFGVSYVESSTGLVPPSMEGGRTEIEMGDINGDGNPDLVSIGDHGSPYINTDQHGIMVWFGDGTGTWSVHQEGYFGYGGVAIGDVNGDGLLDVGYGMHHNYSSTDFGDQLIEVALGDGTGTHWTPWDDGLATNGESWGMFGTDFADVDLDGDLDIASNSFGSGAGIHVYLNHGDGTWEQSYGFLGGNSDENIVFGDLNGDGIPDFAAGHATGSAYLGDGSGGFTIVDGNLPGSAWSRWGPDLGDIDNDGDDELSFCNSSGGVEVWTYDDGQTWSSLSGTLPASGGFHFSQLRDMDVDGYVDVAAFGNGLGMVWLGDGTGEWVEAASFTTPAPGNGKAFRVGADCDHNGLPDMVLVSEQGSWPSYQNHLRFFKEASVPESLWVTPLAPSPGRIWVGGSVRVTEWTSAIRTGAPGAIDLELSTSGAEGPWTELASSLPNNGSFQWIVPDDISSDECWIRYTVTANGNDVQGLSRGAFQILPKSSLFAPQVDVELGAGTLQLTWLPVSGAFWYYVFRSENAFFEPDTVSFTNRVAILESSHTSYTDATGIGDPDLNVFYRVTSGGWGQIFDV